jgi:hypothetical protein
MTAAVLDYLVALSEPVCRHGESLPGWWSGTGPASEPDRALPMGHLNLGMAHGLAVISCVKSLTQVEVVCCVKAREARLS